MIACGLRAVVATGADACSRCYSFMCVADEISGLELQKNKLILIGEKTKK